MKKQKVGLILFWIAVVWAILWGVIGSVIVDTALKHSTMDEVNQTIWAFGGIWMTLWAFAVPLAALVAGIGSLLYSGAKGSTVWKIGIGIFVGLVIGMVAMQFGHLPPLFGIGGTLILLFFMGIVWLWAKERMALKGLSTTATDFKLVGYVFMLLAAWYICGITSESFLKAFDGRATTDPIHVMIFLVLGWFFLFLGHYIPRKQLDSDES